MSADAVSTLYCANHPDRETMLRCNRCEKPICYHCAVLTEVGYRCKECVRNQQAIYYNGAPQDLPVAAIIGLVLGGLAGAVASLILPALGLLGLIGALFVGPAAGGGIAEVIRRAVGRRRTLHMKWFAAGLCLVGILVGGGFLVAIGGIMAGAPFALLFSRLSVLVFAALTVSTVYARLL